MSPNGPASLVICPSSEDVQSHLLKLANILRVGHVPTVFVSILSSCTPVQVHVLCDLCDLCLRWAAVSSQAVVSKHETKLNVAGLK